MKRRTLQQQGFGLLTVMIALVIIGAVGIISVIVVQRIEDMHKNNNVTNNQNSGDSEEEADDPSTLTLSYHSTTGAFKMKYPKSWALTGYKAGQQVTTLDGNEDHLHLQVASSASKINNFGGDVLISDTAPGDDAWPLYPNGTILQRLSNGIEVWRDNQSQTLKKGITANTCPTIRIASDDAFGYKLKNGKYVSFIGSFCWQTGMSTSYTYGQQIVSDEFNQAIRMLESITQD